MSNVAHALPTGTRIAGYEITSCIGAGGFGITYAGFNKITDRRVAIKEFFPNGVASRGSSSTELVVFDGQEATLRWALRKFEATTTDLCRLSHPNIVQVIDYYPGNNTGYMVMEYLRGLTIEEWLAARERPPQPSMLAPILEPVLDALEYLHGLGFIHRDVAPDNIFICENNRPVLIDFGAASQDRSIPGSSGVPTVIVKKRSFTAPDQARGTSLPNPTADIYSFGAVLYQALTGTPPADGEDRMRDLLLSDKDPYRALETAPPVATSRTMGRAVDQCLVLESRERPQSVRAARQLFDWHDDHGRNRPDGPSPVEVVVDPFSRERDVISSMVLDDPVFTEEPPLRLAPDTGSSQITTDLQTRRLIVLFAVLLCTIAGLAIWIASRRP